MIDTNRLTENVFGLTSLKTKIFDKSVDGSIVLVSCEQASTDAVRLVVSPDNFMVEIFPAEITGEEVAVYEHDSLERACAMFEAIHLYRDLAVKPFLAQANEMI
ncbi:hypothetical protein A3715_35875 [Oleiphilus sp. HI0009]|nr:hypothetical protein A3715_15555 [Oleiphilus sp. HI0009]KZX81236.1 hypothetical protein A3715_35875 [Oleiphilus sp. HI0009]